MLAVTLCPPSTLFVSLWTSQTERAPFSRLPPGERTSLSRTVTFGVLTVRSIERGWGNLLAGDCCTS